MSLELRPVTWKATIGKGGYYDASEGHLVIRDRMTKSSHQSNRPLCVLFHGQGGYGWQYILNLDPAQPTTGTLAQQLTAAGFDMLAVDAGGDVGGGGIYNWGNPGACDAVDDALDWAESAMGLRSDEPIYLVTTSMGNTTSYDWMNVKNSRDRVAAIANTLPGINVQDMYDEVPSPFDIKTKVDLAYAPHGGWNANKAVHDPFPNRASFAGIPTKWFYSVDDTITEPQFVEQWAAENGDELQTFPSLGHSHFNFPYPDLIDFLVEHV